MVTAGSVGQYWLCNAVSLYHGFIFPFPLEIPGVLLIFVFENICLPGLCSL